MAKNHQNQLEEARAHFRACRLVEAYHLFRRYFDRIPFQVETDHAENVAMFVRVLWELGKSHELKFYQSELERHYEKTRDPVVAYPLAVIYRNLPEPRDERAKQLFEAIILDPRGEQYQAKAKMMLAHYYSWKKDNLGACRELIFSIEEPRDPPLRALWEIWKAKILRDEKKYDEAQAILDRLFSWVTLEGDWYAYYSAKVVQAILYLKEGRVKEAEAVTAEVRSLFAGRNFKSLKIELDALEKQIGEKSQMGPIRYVTRRDADECVYGNQRLILKRASPSEKLLSFLVKKKFIDKATAVRLLYGREYYRPSDDRLVYYHVHLLRKRLKDIGVPPGAILSEKNGYRLIPRVEVVEDEAWS